MTIPPHFLGPYIGSNVVAFALLVAAYRWPRVSRILFVVLFLGAGAFNIATAITDPEAYMVYADLALLDVYRDFIRGFFADRITVLVGAIAVCQLAIAGLLAGSGWLLKAGAAGGIIFFVAIAPLGVGSAFPSTLLLATALAVLARREL